MMINQLNEPFWKYKYKFSLSGMKTVVLFLFCIVVKTHFHSRHIGKKSTSHIGVRLHDNLVQVSGKVIMGEYVKHLNST